MVVRCNKQLGNNYPVISFSIYEFPFFIPMAATWAMTIDKSSMENESFKVGFPAPELKFKS